MPQAVNVAFLAGLLGKVVEDRGQIAVAGKTALKSQAQPISTGLGFLCQSGIIGLRLIDQLVIIAKIHLAQLGMTIQPERLPDKGIKLTHQKIGQVEGREFLAGGKRLIAFEETIAMRPGTISTPMSSQAAASRPPVPQSA